jgi:WhiB family transcriptional regulator, redox-sensing transcriptional regulator
VFDLRAPLPEWQRDAACKGHAHEAYLWFPDGRLLGSAPAKKICAGCPVRTECLEYALNNDIWSGIWGGMTESERRRLIFRADAARLETAPAHTDTEARCDPPIRRTSPDRGTGA